MILQPHQVFKNMQKKFYQFFLNSKLNKNYRQISISMENRLQIHEAKIKNLKFQTCFCLIKMCA